MFSTFALSSCVGNVKADEIKPENNQTVVSYMTENQAEYKTGQCVKLTVDLKEKCHIHQWGNYVLSYVSPFGEKVDIQKGQWNLNPNEQKQFMINWNPPTENDKGYTVELKLLTDDEKNVVSESTVGVSVDNNYLDHPREGALTNFSDDSQKTTDNVDNDVKTLADKYHLNMAMLYDDYYRPQNPLPTNVNNHFKNWIGDDIDEQLVKKTVETQHDNGQASGEYNMINATTGFNGDKNANLNDRNWQTTGSGNERQLMNRWGIFDKNGEMSHFDMLNGNEDVDRQWYYNPASKDWQNYIGSIMNATLGYYNFDFWQGDTIGNLTGTTYENRKTDKTFQTADTFGDFAKGVLPKLNGKALGINALNGQGNNQLSNTASYVYSEMWQSDVQTYKDLADKIEEMSNQGKSLVVPAYMYHDWVKNNAKYLPKYYDDNAILLKDAVIMANGGSPMELADNGYLINNEYYPDMRKNPKIQMSDKLGNSDTGELRHYYDFETAYQNVLSNKTLKLRDNYIQVWRGNDWLNRNDARTNSIYAFSKTNHNFDTLNLINLMNVQNINWQVNNHLDEQNKAVQDQQNLTVKYYPTTDNIKHVYLSSPDSFYQSKRQELHFESHKDNTGNTYLTFTVPKLHIWDLIYMTD